MAALPSLVSSKRALRRWLGAWALWACGCAWGATTVIFPRVETLDEPEGDYAVALLRLALEKAGGQYQVSLSPLPMQQNRAMLELEQGSGRVDILATVTSAEREQRLLPVRIPLTKGLVGWRIGLLRTGEQERLRKVRDLAGLRAFSAAQGADWPDTAILRNSGLTVVTAASYRELFNMLGVGQVDWMPRSVNEVWADAARHPGLAVEPALALHYPAADYFFVRRGNTGLAEAVRQGVEAALADGSFDRLFYQHYGALIRRAALAGRRVIELPNPLLPPETPLGRRELWFVPDDAPNR
ncbi:transporter substrate-binding domain-containing protein [Duganella sp. LX20W]|uniref:Transporter substrate-binding domain-containing protein n=1 Tax=Rugamonas brunnea TaxID=2758569 RepID=A0A7W2ESR8_9BURK|nr:transporter substrate-binding domain-containing protein [Rugamonas brunnea]MBA5637952.1 transporter substrate-binding domain-containing protein [Rugamonas brunnea]